MSKKHKYILDAVMTLIMVLLMKIGFVGLLWHEILGLGIFMLFLFHNILNFKYISCIVKKFFSDCVKFKVKFGIFLDLFLSVTVIGIVFTGILISKEIFPFGVVGFVSSLHHSLSYLSLILISVHVGLHWFEILGAFRKLFKLENVNRARTYGLRLVTLLIVFFGIKGSFNQNVATNLLEFKNFEDGKDVVANKFDNFSRDEEDDDKKAAEVSTTPVQSLEEFLSKLHCDGCRKHCPLTAPQCNIGVEKAIEAREEYKTTKEASNVSDNQISEKAVSSLEEYLSKLYCNGCSRHCPLSSPQCGVGEEQVIEATGVYYQDKAVGEVQYSFKVGEVLTDYLPIMSMYVAGTHYLVMIPNYLKKRV